MPYKEKQIEKIYWSISEVAEMLNVSLSLLRFWENEFDIIQPRKNRKGDRYYSKKDIQNLKMIYHLVKEKGYTLKGAKQRLSKKIEDVEAQQSAIETLKKLRSFLVEIKEQL